MRLSGEAKTVAAPLRARRTEEKATMLTGSVLGGDQIEWDWKWYIYPMELLRGVGLISPVLPNLAS
jgi:hypothetical protein